MLENFSIYDGALSSSMQTACSFNLLFNLIKSVTSSFTHHLDNNNYNNSGNNFEKTKVLYGSNNVVDMALQFASNAKNRIDACVDHTRPSLIVEIKN